MALPSTMSRPWDDPRLRKFLEQPGASSFAPPGPTPTGMGSGSDRMPPMPPPPTRDEQRDAEIGSSVDDALSAFDQHREAEKENPTPKKPEGAFDDVAALKGNYYDEELPPILQPKDPEPIEKPNPDKTWRVVDAIASGLSGRGYDSGYWQGVDDRARRQYDVDVKKRETDMAKNPGSSLSRAAQGKWREYLKAAGWTDADVNRLSAADAADLNIANVADFRAKAKQRLAELGEQHKYDAAQKGEQRQYDETKTKEKQEFEAGQKDLDRAAAEERARIIANGRAFGKATEYKREDEKLAIQQRKDYELKRDQSGITRGKMIIERLRRNIAAARQANNGEIFGFKDESIRRGPKDGWAFMSPEGRAVMEDLQLLQNAQIKDTSGQAVTVSEMPRVVAGFGTGIFSGEGDLERYLDRYGEELDTFDNSYQRAYQQGAYAPNASAPAPRGGGGGKPQAKPSGGGKHVRYVDPNTGKTRKAPNDPKTLEALKAAGVDYEETE